MVAALVLAAVLGLVVGSFLNVVVYRLPRGENLTHPGSHCPSCDHAGPALRQHPRRLAGCCCAGRCRDCGKPISARYPPSRRSPRPAGSRSSRRSGTTRRRSRSGIVLVTLMVPSSRSTSSTG